MHAHTRAHTPCTPCTTETRHAHNNSVVVCVCVALAAERPRVNTCLNFYFNFYIINLHHSFIYFICYSRYATLRATATDGQRSILGRTQREDCTRVRREVLCNSTSEHSKGRFKAIYIRGMAEKWSTNVSQILNSWTEGRGKISVDELRMMSEILNLYL